MNTYSDQFLDEYNDTFSRHVISAGYYYKTDHPDGINIALTSGIVNPHLIRKTVKVAEVTGHIGYRKVQEGELSVEDIIGMTEELIRDVKMQPTNLLSEEKLKEQTIYTGIIAGNIITLLLLGHIQNDEHNGYSYEVNSTDAKPLR